jgi:transcriptional regulator with XRE-family HTH domain
MQFTVDIKPSPSLGGRIAQARRFSGMTQQEFADQLGVAKKTVHNWEHDVNEASISGVRNIAELTGFPLLWLIEGDGAPRRRVASQVTDGSRRPRMAA